MRMLLIIKQTLEKQRRSDSEDPLLYDDLTKFIDIAEFDDQSNPLFDKLARAPIRRRRINAFEKQQGKKESDIALEQEVQQIQFMLD